MSRNVDYTKSIIYKLCSKDPNVTDIYVGSTTNFRSRKYDHKSKCNNKSETNKKYNLKVYKFIRDNGGFENWEMIMLQEYSCENKKQLQSRERYYIELLKSSLNGQLPTRTQQEYNIDNEDKIKDYQKEYQKQYYENNKDKILEQNKQYRLDNKDTMKEYHKQYRLDNNDTMKDYQKEYQKQYYLKNKSK